MKIQVTNYTFDASAKQITFTDYLDNGINLDRVLLIANQTRNTIIYSFMDSTKGGSVASNVLTLTFDTTLYADTDKLLIFYEDPDAAQKITLATLLAGEGLQDKVLGIQTKPVSGQIYSPSIYTPGTTNVSKDFIKSSPGNIISFYMNRIDTTGLLWLQFFNLTAAPAGGATPILSLKIPIPPAADVTHPTEIKLGKDFFQNDWFTVGIAYGISTDKNTFVDAVNGTNSVIRALYT